MNSRVQQHKNKGFTLLETLIYVGLLALMLSFVLIVFYQVLDNQGDNRTRADVAAESNFMMQKISWGFSGAQSISQFAAASSSATIAINKYSFSQNPLTFVFSSSTAVLSRAGGQAVPVLSSNVRLNSLLLIHEFTSGNSLGLYEISYNSPLSTSSNSFSLSQQTLSCPVSSSSVSSFFILPVVGCNLPELVYVSFTLASPPDSRSGASTTMTSTFYFRK